MEYVVVCLVALGASALTLFSGFGLGTVLMPAFALFFPYRWRWRPPPWCTWLTIFSRRPWWDVRRIGRWWPSLPCPAQERLCLALCC